jgi:hypothetical protein
MHNRADRSVKALTHNIQTPKFSFLQEQQEQELMHNNNRQQQ